MTLKKNFGIFAIATSLVLLAFDLYWYIIRGRDVSNFVAFALISLLGISIGIIFLELSKDVDKIKGDLAYVEEKALEHIEGEK